MNRILTAGLVALSITLGACTSMATIPSRSVGARPEPLVAPSSFTGVHGLAVDPRAGCSPAPWSATRSGRSTARPARRGCSSGPPRARPTTSPSAPTARLAWTNYLMGMLRYRENDAAPMRVLAKDLPGPQLARLRSPQRQALRDRRSSSATPCGRSTSPATKPPRLIAKDLGGFNGFEVGPDGMLYGPLWFKGQVVEDRSRERRHHRDQQRASRRPAAANLDGKGNLWVVDTRDRRTVQGRTGERPQDRGQAAQARARQPGDRARRHDLRLEHGRQLGRGLQPRDRRVAAAHLRQAGGAGRTEDRRQRLWVADIFGFRKVDASDRRSAATSSACSAIPSMEYPFAVGLSATHFALSSWFTGTVQLVDRATLKTTP